MVNNLIVAISGGTGRIGSTFSRAVVPLMATIRLLTICYNPI
jgi:hypothetical protein